MPAAEALDGSVKLTSSLEDELLERVDFPGKFGNSSEDSDDSEGRPQFSL